MEEQGANSRVDFKNEYPPSKPQMEEDGVYCNVEMKAPASALKSAPDTGDKKAVLVVVCVLLLVMSIAALIYLAITMTNQRAENEKLTSEHGAHDHSKQWDNQPNSNEQKFELENQDLIRQRDSLNWTLGVIMMFTNFPVNSFCPQKPECQPCLSEWIPFKDHCYFFFNETSSWKQWDESQTYCKDLNPISDLVVIESPEEQEFIYNHTQSYFDKFHGFWIGLSQIANNSWVWVDGQTDTLGYLMKKDLGKPGPKALMIPNQPLNESWSPADPSMPNNFICESKALIKV